MPCGAGQVAAVVQAQVKSIDLMSGRPEERDKHGPDVTAVASNEDLHRAPLRATTGLHGHIRGDYEICGCPLMILPAVIFR